MDEQTRVNRISIREKRRWIQPPLAPVERVETSAQLSELPKRKSGWQAFLQPENLSRNLAVVGCLALVVLALNQSKTEDNVSVFSALKGEMTATWDEDIGKLSFVSELLPPEIREVWNPSPVTEIMSPMQGDIVHTWSRQEPYLELASNVRDVRAASDGEVMSIAHGLDEEKIIRIRHHDGHETLYGNLQATFVEIGDPVRTGDIIGNLLPEKPVTFELKINGRSVDPVPCMAELSE